MFSAADRSRSHYWAVDGVSGGGSYDILASIKAGVTEPVPITLGSHAGRNQHRVRKKISWGVIGRFLLQMFIFIEQLLLLTSMCGLLTNTDLWTRVDAGVEPSACPSAVYPGWRWERFMHQMGPNPPLRRT